jgi:cellulose synthase/poly-beta-1,6-N-acetylglucosamine synthase-like glycosyltransferase
MRDIEIPLPNARDKTYRFYEILPGMLSWTILLLPIILSQISPRITVVFVIAYLLLWFAKSIGMQIRAVQGYRTLRQHEKLPWSQLLDDVARGEAKESTKHIPNWHYDNILLRKNMRSPLAVEDLRHAIIIAGYNEANEVIEPTIQSVLASDFDMSKVMLILAYEERGGEDMHVRMQGLLKKYAPQFGHAMAFRHPKDIPNEVIGKGGNITYAGRELQKYLEAQHIDPLHVIVTTLDSDNRPDKNYLNCLTYLYVLCDDPRYVSFQPVPMYTNNIWDAPAPMRVIATGNSFWMIVQGLRTHSLRNFSAHAQSMQALINTDFWSVRTIVEDGHQFWRTYFRYNGRHEVYPIFLPIYQDAVLSNTYVKTLKAQFIQLRRWAWGASDVAYVAQKGFYTPNKVPRISLVFKFLRLLEGHVSWATAPLILAFAAFVPSLLHSDDFAANQLPIIASRVQTVALAGIFITLFFSIKTLPPKPARYKAHRTVFMLLQWVLLPVTTILYSSFSAINSQTRLMFKRYLGKFDLTDKAVVTADKKVIM